MPLVLEAKGYVRDVLNMNESNEILLAQLAPGSYGGF